MVSLCNLRYLIGKTKDIVEFNKKAKEAYETMSKKIDRIRQKQIRNYIILIKKRS